MIKKPKRWDDVSTDTYIRLPKGAYQSKILGVNFKNINGTNYLEISTDITDGEYTDYWKNEYQNQKFENKFWRSSALVVVPDDSSEDKDIRSFKRFAYAVEDSNEGFRVEFPFNEQLLKGKKIGAIYRDEERVYNGKKYTDTKLISFCTIEEVIDGTYYKPKDKLLSDDQKKQLTDQTSVLPQTNIDITSDDLPF